MTYLNDNMGVLNAMIQEHKQITNYTNDFIAMI